MSSPKKRPAARKSIAPANSLAARADKNLLFLPVVLAMAIIPLIVHLVIVNVDQTEAALFGAEIYGDSFSRAKAFVLLAFIIVMLIVAVAHRRKLFVDGDWRMKIYFSAAGVLLIFTFLSAACSKYPSVAFWGAHDRAEGFVTLFCYIVLFLYTVYACRGETDCRHLLAALGVVLVVSSFVGAFQYFGYDLIGTAFGKALIISPWDRDSVQNVGSQYGAGSLYGTFFHYDYVGSFAAMTVPLFLVLAIAAKEKRQRLLLAGGVLLSLWLLVGSTSRAGVVGVLAAAVVALVFFARVIVRRWKISLSCIAVLLVAAVGLNFVSKGKIFARVPSLFADAAGIFQQGGKADYLSQLPVKNVASEGMTVAVTTQHGDVLKATLSGSSLALKDGDGKTVSVAAANGVSTITDERFKRFSFQFVPLGATGETGLAVTIDGQNQFYFRMNGSKLQMTNAAGTWDVSSLATPPSYGFAGKEKLGSSRGYIWSRANALVPGCLILGFGPDTFALHFPQNDLLGKYWAYGTTNMVVDKPHNLYLQILLNDGGIALLAFMAIVLFYLVDSIRLYALKKEYALPQAFGAAISLAVVGYLFAGLFNDSVVSVAPVFWILLGVGVAVNFRSRKAIDRGPAETPG